jgi:predicted nuclease of predicted toxin-antitoxin system
MDVHVPAAITLGLRRREVDVLTAQTDNAGRIPDDVLLERATALGRVLVTQDEDLLAEAERWQREGKPFAGVAYAHQLRVTIGQCVNDLELMAKVYEPADMADRVEHLPLKQP